ncbi:MAG: S28 family serine protease [Bacteroidales bacterium]|nr:S28 family serine protease [Bacteroidales bacterium]
MYKPFLFLFLSIFLIGQSSCTKKHDLEGFLKGLSNVSIEEIDSLEGYQSCYKIMLRQKVDHFGTDTSTFLQKIYLSHFDVSKPTVIVTEGYSANKNYLTELAKLLDANQIIVEHRYFNDSRPQEIDWKYLNIKQAAEDHHIITSLFKEFYDGKWLSTGISKGGQTCLYYKYFYPNDVDVTVPYVAPINFSKEEPRVFNFLNTVGSDSCRQKVFEFQKLLLKHRSEIMPLFEQYAKDNGMTFKMGTKAAFEYCVLEFSFAFWQWGDLSCNEIPKLADDINSVFQAFEKVGFSFFSEEGTEPIRPFYYQALTEIGFYTYDIEPFGDLIQEVKDPNFNFTLPEGVDTSYNYQSMRAVNDFLQTKGNHIIFIYGEYDPWSASAVQLIPDQTNALKMVKAGGNHKTRIKSFDQAEKEMIYGKLEEWLGIKIE